MSFNKSHISVLVILMLSCVAPMAAQDEEPSWGINLEFGGATMHHDDDKCWELLNDEGNVFDINVDYRLSRHFSLNAGLYAEHQGLFTNFAHGLGLKKQWVGGLHAGTKFYPVNPSFPVQPYIGANIYTNFFDLKKYSGSKLVSTSNGHPGECVLSYDIKQPFLSVSPQIGLELRLISSLSFTVSYDYRFALHGHSNATIQYVNGPLDGMKYTQLNNNSRGILSFGIKIDFPIREVSEKGRRNLLLILSSWISGNASN